jgi:hypothetical protein
MLPTSAPPLASSAISTGTIPNAHAPGDWLVSATEGLDCFGLPTIAPDHKAAMDALVEELIFKHPLYMPVLTEPAPWTRSVNEHVDGISDQTFIKTDPPRDDRGRRAGVCPVVLLIGRA